jgi:hypothetical protein
MKNVYSILEKDYALIEKDNRVNIYSGVSYQLENLSELFALQRSTQNKVSFITPFSLVKKEK